MAIPVYKEEQMHTLLTYIENNIALDMETEILTKLGLVSHTQLYRDFYAYTGHSVREYIRRRRLSNALNLIKTSDLTLADIAYTCGYSSQQDLCRRVKNAVHMTPRDYKDSEQYYFFPPVNSAFPSSAAAGAESPIMVSTQSIPAALCLRFYSPINTDIEDRAVNHLLEIAPAYRGRVWGRDGKVLNGAYCYELYISEGASVQEALTHSAFLIGEQVPAHTAVCATTLVQNREERITDAWNYLCYEWLPDSMFVHSGEPYFEEYLFKHGRVSKLKLYLPLKKRQETVQFSVEYQPARRFVLSEACGSLAEEKASKRVMEYMAQHHPALLRTSRGYYIHKDGTVCVCGLQVPVNIRLEESREIRVVCRTEGRYLILRSQGLGDYGRLRCLAAAFMKQNSIHADMKEMFTVYNIGRGGDSPSMHMYCPVIK